MWRLAALPSENVVKRRQNKKRERGRTGSGRRSQPRRVVLNFAAGSGGEEHRDESERGDTGGDENGSEAQDRAFYHRKIHAHASPPAPVVFGIADLENSHLR